MTREYCAMGARSEQGFRAQFGATLDSGDWDTSFGASRALPVSIMP